MVGEQIEPGSEYERLVVKRPLKMPTPLNGIMPERGQGPA